MQRLSRAAWASLILGVCGCAQIAGLEDRHPREKAASAYREAVLHDQPTGYFRFGESSGATVVVDEVSGLSGTVEGELAFEVTGALAGDDDTAIGFDGLTTGIDVGDHFDLPNRDPFTIEFWFKTHGYDNPRIVEKMAGAGTTREGFEVFLSSAGYQGLQLGRLDGTAPGDFVHTPVAENLPTNTFVYGAITGDATQMRIFINGDYKNQDALEKPRFPDVSVPFLFGKQSGGGTRYDGVLDEFAIYDRVLSDEQIKTHYEIGTTP